MDVPSMVQRSGDTLIVRSVVSGDQIFVDQEGNINNNNTTNTNNNHVEKQQQQQQSMGVVPPTSSSSTVSPVSLQNFEKMLTAQKIQQQQLQMQQNYIDGQMDAKDEQLPQCKIKRNYSCSYCTYFTQNPRYHLQHLRDVHGEKIVINKCKLCLYASRHYQKLVRHMKMVHGSTEGIADSGQSRKRLSRADNRKRKMMLPAVLPLPPVLMQPLLQQQIPTQPQSQPPQPQLSQKLSPEFPPSTSMMDVGGGGGIISGLVENTQNRILKCSVCEFSTLYKDQLVEHEQKEHQKTKFFRCEKCNYVTHIKARFSKHVKYHSMPMIKCETCDFRTPYKWNLDRHMKNHGGTGVFKCAACDFTADIKQSLTVHEMNHHIPPVGNAAGMNLIKTRRQRIGPNGEIIEEFLSDTDEYLLNNNNTIDDFDDAGYPKKFRFGDSEDDEEMDDEEKSQTDQDQEQPTDLSQRKTTRPIPNLIPIEAANNLWNFASLYLQNTKLLQQLEKNIKPQEKKPLNFFEKLKESFPNQNDNLACNCGHISKCLSELIIHRNSCHQQQQQQNSSADEGESKPQITLSPVNLSTSTRCQYCRHRCKSSADLINHMKNCSADTGSNDSMSGSCAGSNGRPDYEEEAEEHPMENKVFIWNKLLDNNNISIVRTSGSGSLSGSGAGGSTNSSMCDPESPQKRQPPVQGFPRNEEISYYGVETAPGYGEVTKKMSPDDEAGNSSLKKVYKCPHCSFWASTASRFHVHIVGHLNKKPFECSLCAYRSNWRWDITKHIRLKTIRDPSHKQAHVLMNDETGRRNYTKYNKYITLMKVTEEDGDPKLMKSGEMTPNQEASLSFINDYKNHMSKMGLIGNSISDHEMDQNDQHLQDLQHSDTFSSLAHFQEGKGQPPPLIRPSDDLIVDVKIEGFEKKTSFRCRKCNFSHMNRDAVLAHVKIHYQDSNKTSLVNQQHMNNVIAAMCLTQQIQQQLQVQNNSNIINNINNNINHNNNNNNNSSSNNQNIGTTSSTSVPSTSSSPTIVTNEHGETEERHCRLKHGADIRIENIDRSSDKIVYRPLLNNGQQQQSHQSSIHNHQQSPHHQSHSMHRTPVIPAGFPQLPQIKLEDSSESKAMKFKCPSCPHIFASKSQLTFHMTLHKTDDNVDQLLQHSTLYNASKSKQMKCPTCHVILESKSQMNYHISLHKTSQYECHMCEYVSTKKQQLLNHIKSCHPEPQQVQPQPPPVVPQFVSFCSKCPSRYLNIASLQNHFQHHGTDCAFKCEACDFSSSDEKEYLAHTFSHTADYQNKTEILLRSNQMDPSNMCPAIVKTTLQNSNTEVWIVKKEEEDSLLKKQLTLSLDTSPSDIKEEGLEKCCFCPFECTDGNTLQEHTQNHFTVSRIRHDYRCDHCDYTTSREDDLDSHLRCHFKGLLQPPNVSLRASFEKLELSLTSDKKEILLYKEAMMNYGAQGMVTRRSSAKNNNGKAIIVDAETGQIITRN